ncbi:MAG: FmdB family zinc ribbon protein [Gemmatimonadaceae bacterium]
MPLYEFRCPCGHDFEKFYRSIGSASPEEPCPQCGVVAVRLMSTAGLVFKGSGFYITDYGKDGKKDERDAAATAKTAQETKAKAAEDKKTASTAGDSSAGDGKAASSSKPTETAAPASAGATASKPAETAAKVAPASVPSPAPSTTPAKKGG